MNTGSLAPMKPTLQANCISMDSPLAKALLRKSIDDEVLLVLNERRDTFLVAGIRYE